MKKSEIARIRKERKGLHKSISRHEELFCSKNVEFYQTRALLGKMLRKDGFSDKSERLSEKMSKLRDEIENHEKEEERLLQEDSRLGMKIAKMK